MFYVTLSYWKDKPILIYFDYCILFFLLEKKKETNLPYRDMLLPIKQ